ncbi:MAG: flagellar motor switch protein FliG [Proteobacteria bacterium]|nr:flagellar motor switch protein FliG [Pseudomonadota bacterium]
MSQPALPARPIAKEQASDTLSGPQKAAVVMLALGDQAATILGQLDEEEVRLVSETIANLGIVQHNIVEAVTIDFFDRLTNVSTLIGSYEHTQRLLTSVLPKERVDALMEELRGPAGRSVWEKLTNVNEAVLAGYLAHEYPQTVAIILLKLKPDFAARVLGSLPDEFGQEVIGRMLAAEPVSRDILEQIEVTLRNEFISNLTRSAKRDSHEIMAEIFNNFDRQTESRFMSGLDHKNQQSAERIRALMFLFEDLAKLDSGGVQTLLRATDKSDLSLALKGASEALRALFLSNMSERGAKLLREEMQALGPVRLKDVDAAQTKIVALAKDLAARGELMLAQGRSEDELIY